MNFLYPLHILSIGIALLCPLVKAQECEFHFVNFELDTEIQKPVVPHITIDTNLDRKAFLIKGKVESKKPYHILFNLTDEEQKYALIEITKSTVTYDDGITEKSIEDLDLPYRIKPRIIKSFHMDGGRIALEKVRHFTGKLSNVITRDESFKLDLEGSIKEANGRKIPIKIDYDYSIQIVKGMKPLQR